jgi:hypothetical protein
MFCTVESRTRSDHVTPLFLVSFSHQRMQYLVLLSVCSLHINRFIHSSLSFVPPAHNPEPLPIRSHGGSLIQSRVTNENIGTLTT